MTTTRQRHRDHDDTEPTFATEGPLAFDRHWRKVEDDDELEVRKDANLDDNELYDGGNLCSHCHEMIEPGQYVRRTASGEWQHEVCWYRSGQAPAS